MRRGLSYHNRRSAGGYNPFSQLGPTLDLIFAGNVTNLSDPNGFTLDANFLAPQYLIGEQYTIWETGVGLVSKTFSQIITFTRASTGTFFNSSGVLTSAAINDPRFDYNPSTLAAQGLLIEEARTNSIRNNTMQGAVAGTPGTAPTNWAVSTAAGITRELVGTGTENGITYIDYRFSGTATGTSDTQFEQANIVAALSGQTWAHACYFRVAAGSLANVTLTQILSEYTSAGAFLAASSQNITPTAAGLASQRFTLSRTLNNASTAFTSVAIRVASAGAIDITLRIGLPQLELGAFATSVIPTTTTALTRSADVASVNTLSPWFNSTGGTLYAESFRTTIAAASTFPSYAEFDNGALNRYGFYNALTAGTNEYGAFATDAGVSQAAMFGAASRVSAGTVVKQAAAFATNDFAFSINASSVFTDTAGTLPSSVNRMCIGSSYIAANFANAWIRRITYYPRRLSNAELVSITTP